MSNEQLIIELSESDVMYACTCWLKEKYKNDSRGEFNCAGNINFELKIRDVGQGRLEPRFEGAVARVWFTEKEKANKK